MIIEVLSPGTQRYDRGDKRTAYRAAPSLAEYMTVVQHEAVAERQTSRESVIDRIEEDEAVLCIEREEFEIPLATLYA